MLTSPMKQRINLSLDDKLIERAKLQAVLQKRSVSKIIEALLGDYLNSLETRKGKAKS